MPDEYEMIQRWEDEGGRPDDTSQQSDRQHSPLLDVVQHFASQGVV